MCLNYVELPPFYPVCVVCTRTIWFLLYHPLYIPSGTHGNSWPLFSLQHHQRTATLWWILNAVPTTPVAMEGLVKSRKRTWDDTESLTTDIYNNVNDSQFSDLQQESLQWGCHLHDSYAVSPSTMWESGASCCGGIRGHWHCQYLVADNFL